MGISFRKHKDKKWEYRVKVKDPITKKYVERSKRGFETKPEARLAAQDVERNLLEGYEKLNIQLKDYLDFWLKEYKEGYVRKNTMLSLKNSVNNHIKPYFKNIYINEITPALYQKFLNKLYDNKLSKNTRLRIHNAFNEAMKRAVLNKKITFNPCEGAVIKGKNSNNDEIKFIEPSEVPMFLEHSYEYGYIYWIFFKLLLETGMRKGEAAALKWSDINFKNMTIEINKSLDFQAETDEELFGDTKNYNSKRVISMSKSIADDLRYHATWQNRNKKLLKNKYYYKYNLVLCRKDGNYMPKSSLFNAFRRILKQADMNLLPIHSLRHTHAVMLLEAGAEMKYIQERLGHGSITITSDIYSHISKKMDQKNTAQFEKYINNILNSK
ncbi:tyrosine-type recombinase/integrase [Virgibacillus chiguensis]|uniref:Site-specific recombinase XerD n=1 Tax=Virgibacillus chiguensis TaxID=411959 RepID=A0A1M5N007_9BACI|nr:tyrosine-type recombinase/integrase [Virgibacillus chiguensis]SHG82817.1 Site-specific recombinase XerD [Virgibacillus chiguensis]